MKILIVQFARLGDIYLSWPITRALKRIYPQGEIHYLARPRFKAALNGIDCVDKVWTLPTDELFGPLLDPEFKLQESLNALDGFYEELQNEKFDQIINLSFSPASSFLVKSISTPNTQIAGYTRHSDGYVHLADDISRYFWAQVGPEFPNRIHLVDLFGALAGVDFAPEDFREPHLTQLERTIAEKYFVLHIGASETHKNLEARSWAEMIQAYSAYDQAIKWVLVGSKEEAQKATQIEAMTGAHFIINRVGLTAIEDLFGLIKYSEGLIGCDSVAMHMAPFVKKRAFCVSSGQVKFWETGPISSGSAVCEIDSIAGFQAARVALKINQWTTENFSQVHQAIEDVTRFQVKFPKSENEEFAWNLVKAIYMSGPFPMTSDLNFYKGCLKLYEANAVALQNISRRHLQHRGFLTSVLDRVDEIFLAVVGQVPALTPLFRWYQAEKTRIQPGTFDQIAQDTAVIHQVFSGLLKKYLLEEDVRKAERDGTL
jgi:heptosyltransferase III